MTTATTNFKKSSPLKLPLKKPAGKIVEMVSKMNSKLQKGTVMKEDKYKAGQDLLKNLLKQKSIVSPQKTVLSSKTEYLPPKVDLNKRPDYLIIPIEKMQLEEENNDEELNELMEDIDDGDDEDGVRNRKIKKKKSTLDKKRIVALDTESKTSTQKVETPKKVETPQTKLTSAIRKLDFNSETQESNSGFKPRNATVKDEFETNEDGSIDVYWIDAVEEKIRQNNVVLLFGKVKLKNQNVYTSITVIVKNITRKCYVLPRDSQAETIPYEDIFNEFWSKLQQTCPTIKETVSKFIKRSYCFELNLERGEHHLLKCITTANDPRIPQNMFGKTFRHVFNTQQSLLERLILSRKIKGPCWLNIKNFTIAKTGNFDTHSRIEVALNNFKDLFVPLEQKASPPMNLAVINLKLDGKEIVAASLLTKTDYAVEKDSPLNTAGFSTTIFACKPANYDRKDDFQQEIRSKFRDVCAFSGEIQLVNLLLTKLSQFDPDIICGHNLYNGILETLIEKFNKYKVNRWDLIGRMQRKILPKALPQKGNSVYRVAIAGRLPLCSYSAAQDMLRESNYSVGFLAEKYLNTKHEDIDFTDIPSLTRNIEGLTFLVDNMIKETMLIFKLQDYLKILQLTKELTCIAGNLWVKSLEFSRNDRNEYLLLHNFNSQKYILPDKVNRTEDEEKSKYSGGLVLEPLSDLYNTVVLLLDFNSLYPSIIQEFNLCFCTVDRPSTRTVNAEFRAKEEAKEDDEEKLVEAIDVEALKRNKHHSILPPLLKSLVDKRKQVKNLIKNETDPSKLQILDIKQKAYKLTANSLYGCLGYKNSRFYARVIAALITNTGRNILKATADLVTENEFQVIYGDTDSIMVNTRQLDYEKARQMGEKIKLLVNGKYKQLEIDLDGMFKCLLLLKKKKYAAIKVDKKGSEWVESKEFKGLDLVRRDWCPLSKYVGSMIMDILLSGMEHDAIADKIYGVIEQLNYNIEAGKVPLEDFYMTKQLSKEVADYGKKTNLAHVEVARRLKDQGEPINAGMHINYLICRKKGESNKESQKDKAFHPNEFKHREDLEIDIEFYKENQLITSIARLCKHVTVLEMDRIRELLGLHKKEFNQKDIVVTGEVTASFSRFGFNIFCDKCGNSIAINEFNDHNFIVKLICECGADRSKDEALISNSLRIALKNTLRENMMCKLRKQNLNVTRSFYKFGGEEKVKEIHSAKQVSDDIHFLEEFATHFINKNNLKKSVMVSTLEAIRDVRENLEFDMISLENVFACLK